MDEKRVLPRSEPQVRAGSLRAWTVAARPASLLVALSAVLVGAAFGYERTGALDPIAALLVLGCALLMQVITNMQNDVGYTVRGADRSQTRTGLPRATAKGWLTVRAVRRGIAGLVALSIALACALVAERGWPVLAIGAASLLGALGYMGGPWPIAYTPFGELTVFVFFGLVAVTGTDWVLAGSVGGASVLAAGALGALAAAALAVNNHRDIAHDRLVGRRTFAVIFGASGSHVLFTALLASAFLLVPVMALQARAPTLLLPLLLVPAAARLRRDFRRCPPGIAFNGILFRAFRLELGFAALLAAGACVARFVR